MTGMPVIEFIQEILLSFHTIIRMTTIDLWENKNKQTNLAKASNKLKARMQAIQTNTITQATAAAITKATETIEAQEQTSATTNILLTNVEKQIQRNTQEANKLILPM